MKPPGTRRVVVGSVGISIPRGWNACMLPGLSPSGLDGPVVAFGPRGAVPNLYNSVTFQVDPPPGDELFDARNIDNTIRNEAYPNNVGIVGEIDVPNAIQTAASEYHVKGFGRKIVGFDGWAMGVDETRVRLSWIGDAKLWERMERVYRDLAASIDFEPDAAPTRIGFCTVRSRGRRP